MTYNLGQAVKLSTAITDASGAATDATVTLTITKPDGTTSTPSVTHDGSTGSGLYEATVTVDQVGTWWWRWDATGAVLDNDRGQITVADPKPPAYIGLAPFKSSMTITATDRDDQLMAALLAGARSIDQATSRRFWLDQAASARVFNPRGRTVATPDGEKLLVDDIGSVADLTVEVGSGNTWSPITDYETLPDNAIARGLPVTALLRTLGCWQYSMFDRVRVTTRWGWPLIPDDIALANQLQSSRLYKRRTSPEGVFGTAEWGVVRVTRVDPDVMALIAPYVDGATG